MDFEWDKEKVQENERKHEVSFFEATEVFADELSSSVADPDSSEGEYRYLIFGQTLSGRTLVVSYTERDDRIRIISARLMTRRERRAYEQR
ncbi:MAG: BrnT family toxin [Gammaproteobacteria bacterium]|nr:BrnT family toxin [Gammaproteobacteria bacterium]